MIPSNREQLLDTGNHV